MVKGWHMTLWVPSTSLTKNVERKVKKGNEKGGQVTIEAPFE